jgi:acyl-CoA thioester hydrolase
MDDVLEVVTRPVAVKGASITLAQEVRHGEDVLVKAEVRVAFISEGRAQPIPKALRALLKADQISLSGDSKPAIDSPNRGDKVAANQPRRF